MGTPEENRAIREQACRAFMNMDQPTFEFVGKAVVEANIAGKRLGHETGSMFVIRTTFEDMAKRTNSQTEVKPLVDIMKWYEDTYGDEPGFAAMMLDLAQVEGIRNKSLPQQRQQSGCAGMVLLVVGLMAAAVRVMGFMVA